MIRLGHGKLDGEAGTLAGRAFHGQCSAGRLNAVFEPDEEEGR